MNPLTMLLNPIATFALVHDWQEVKADTLDLVQYEYGEETLRLRFALDGESIRNAENMLASGTCSVEDVMKRVDLYSDCEYVDSEEEFDAIIEDAA